MWASTRMGSFGRRGLSNSGRAPAIGPRAAPEGRLAPSIAGRRLLMMACFIGFIFLIRTWHSFVEDGRPLERDYSPGLQIDGGPYRAPSGCPERNWDVGDFMPASCIAPYRMYLPQLALAALEEPYRSSQRRHSASYRSRMWVRAGEDAVLVARPGDTAGQVLKVISSRFASSPDTASRAYGADTENYTDPPSSYLLSAARNLLLPVIIVGPILALVLWAMKRWPSLAENPPRWPWRAPSSEV